MKAADIGGSRGSAIVRFEEAGETNVTDYRADGALEIPVTPHTPSEWATGGNDPKTWSLNRTSENTALDHLGETTEEWIGQLIRINVTPQNVRGQMRDVLYSEAIKPEEQPKARAPPTAKPAAAAPATAATPIYTEAEILWLKYNELLINTTIDPEDWQRIPKDVRTGLQTKGVLIDKAGYPFLLETAREALR